MQLLWNVISFIKTRSNSHTDETNIVVFCSTNVFNLFYHPHHGPEKKQLMSAEPSDNTYKKV